MNIGSDKNLGQYIMKKILHHKLIYKQHLSNKLAYKEPTKDKANNVIDNTLG